MTTINIHRITTITLIILFFNPTGKAYSQENLVEISKSGKKEALHMPWKKMITIGRAYDLTRHDLIEHLGILQEEIGYEYCRFHAIFDDDMAVVRRSGEGELIFQWHQVNKVYDALLELGLKPFIELNPMPGVMASGDQTIFDYEMNVTPPASYKEWEELITEFVNHLIIRYGREEISKWYFEVWNEPNLPGFWAGTQEEYFKLYEISARAIKKADKNFKVGGPATSKGSWVEDIIHFCNRNDVPIDFVSTHLYPQDEYVIYPEPGTSPYRPGDFFRSKVEEVKHIVKNSPIPDLEIHWTEWNTQSAMNADEITWTKNIYVDNLYAASFIVKNCLELDQAANSFGYWVASDIFAESGIPHSPFSNTYGLLTIHGIPKASFNGFLFMNKMKGYLNDVVFHSAIPANCGLRSTTEGNLTRIILWNHQPVQISDQEVWKVRLRIPELPEEELIMVQAKIGVGNGSAWETWKYMGSPVNLSPGQFELIQSHSRPHYTVRKLKQKDKSSGFSVSLQPGEVVFIEVAPSGDTVRGKQIDPRRLEEWEKSMGDPSS